MDSSARLVLAFIGDDCPGLVYSLAEVLSDHGGNWEFSRMSSRDGLFAGILDVTVAADRAEDLIEDFRALDGILDVLVRRGSRHEDAPDEGPRYVIDAEGEDRPGIVEAVTAAVARPQVNVLRFYSEYDEAPSPSAGASSPGAASRVFRVHAVVRPLADLDAAEFESGLHRVGESVGAHVRVERRD